MVYDVAAREAIKEQEQKESSQTYFFVVTCDVYKSEYFLNLWLLEYDAAQTPESQFANILFRSRNANVNESTQRRASWVENNIRLEQVIARNLFIENSGQNFGNTSIPQLLEAQKKGWLK